MYIMIMKIRELRTASGGEYLSIQEAATLLGIKEGAIRNYLSAGKLTTYKFKNLTLLHIDEIQAWKSRQKKRKAR